jgi:hypothetical protein
MTLHCNDSEVTHFDSVVEQKKCPSLKLYALAMCVPTITHTYRYILDPTNRAGLGYRAVGRTPDGPVPREGLDTTASRKAATQHV